MIYYVNVIGLILFKQQFHNNLLWKESFMTGPKTDNIKVTANGQTFSSEVEESAWHCSFLVRPYSLKQKHGEWKTITLIWFT